MVCLATKPQVDQTTVQYSDFSVRIVILIFKILSLFRLNFVTFIGNWEVIFPSIHANFKVIP